MLKYETGLGENVQHWPGMCSSCGEACLHCIAFALRIALEVVYSALSWHSSDVLVRLRVYNAGRADHEKDHGSMHDLEKVGDTHTF